MLSLVMVIFVLASINIFLSAQLSHIGLDLQQLNIQAQQTQLQITQLKQASNTSSSLISIRSKASNMGFTPEYQAVVLPKTEPVAYQPN